MGVFIPKGLEEGVTEHKHDERKGQGRGDRHLAEGVESSRGQQDRRHGRLQDTPDELSICRGVRSPLDVIMARTRVDESAEVTKNMARRISATPVKSQLAG